MFEKISSRIHGPLMTEFMAARIFERRHREDSLAAMKYRCIRNAYLIGYKFAEKRNKELEEEYFRNMYLQEHGYFDISGFKCPVLDNTILVELCDLWFPYYYSDWPLCFCYEGGYEQYGVNLEENDVVFDVGANVGLFTVYAIKKRKCKVYSFEPVKDTFDILMETIRINSVGNDVFPIKKGIYNYSGISDIYVGKERILGSIVLNDRAVGTEKIQVTSIDDFVWENRIEKVDFIKADIEGAERFLLEGARTTLEKHKPKLAICTYHLPDDKEVLSNIILDANPTYKIEYSSHKLFAH